MGADSRHCDILVVGAGIVGLAVARALRERYPDLSLRVVEKEARVALHQTGRNSGVIHSGVYYRPDSLRARLCVAGAAAMKAFCADHGIPVRECGKVIVATHDGELPQLERIYERARANGVPGVELIDATHLAEREPLTRGVMALWVPGAAIVNYHHVAVALAESLAASGAEVATATRFQSARRAGGVWRVRATGPDFEARHLINCAGLHSDRVAQACGVRPEVRIVPVRGEYYTVHPEVASRLRGMIYPVPDPRFPFLGVHLTPRIDGAVDAGPNALLAFRREGYARTAFSVRDTLDMLFAPGFFSFLWSTLPAARAELRTSLSKQAFARALRTLTPAVEARHLSTWTCGVRAQAVDSRGRMLDDFYFQESEGALHVLNAPSPAATASLSIAKEVTEKASVMIGR